jgi:hypothetical protein
MWVFGITSIAHIAIIAAIAITVTTFKTAEQKPDIFSKKTEVE